MDRRSLAVFALALGLLLLGNDRLILYSLDEVRNAQCAREMRWRADWVVPTYNGDLRTHKPPLAYYAMMGSFYFMGETPFAARFPAAVAGALVVAVVFGWLRRVRGVRAGYLGAALLMASVHAQLQLRMSVPDPYLILSVTLAWGAFYRWRYEGWRWGLVWGYLCAALAILAKGPIGAWLVGAPVLLMLALTLPPRDFLRQVWRLQPVLGLAGVAAAVAPWVLAVQNATDGVWLREFIGFQNVTRFSEPLEGHGGGPLVTLAFVLLGMVPATAFLPQTLRPVWRLRAHEPLRLFALCGVVVTVGTFLVAATRLPNYTTPAYPLLAILVALYLDDVLGGAPARGWWLSAGFAFLFALAVPLGGYYGLKANPDVAHMAPLALLALVPAAVVGLALLLKAPRQRLVALVAGYTLLAALGLGYLYPRIYAENPVSQSLPKIDTTRPVVAYQVFNPAFSFELPRLVPVFGSTDSLAQYLAAQPEATVLTRSEHKLALEALGLKVVHEQRDLFEISTTLVLRW